MCIVLFFLKKIVESEKNFRQVNDEIRSKYVKNPVNSYNESDIYKTGFFFLILFHIYFFCLKKTRTMDIFKNEELNYILIFLI